MGLRPIKDRIIVEPVPDEKVTAGGVVLPDTAGEKPQRAKVIAVGPEVESKIEPDDEILHSRYGGAELRVHGDDLLVLAETDVLAVVE